MTPEDNIRLYEQDTNAEQKIRDAITGAYQNLKPESELVNTYENEQFPSFYSGMSGYGADTGLTNLDPLTLLQNAWGEQSRMATAAQVARDAFDIRNAGMEDLIKTGVGQWATGYQGAQNAYDRWFQQKQFEEQQRQFNAQLAASRGGGGGNGGANAYDDFEAKLLEEAWRLKVEAGNKAQDQWNAGANAAYNKTPTRAYMSTPSPLKSNTNKSALSGYQTKKIPGKQTSKSNAFNKLLNSFRGI